jgi:hypothetical protein
MSAIAVMLFLLPLVALVAYLVLTAAAEAYKQYKRVKPIFEDLGPCTHDWQTEHVTYAAPIHPSNVHWLEQGEARERAMRGTTTVLHACSKCGKRREIVMFGKTLQTSDTSKWSSARNVN